MPLDEYMQYTMEGLQKGDPQIVSGHVVEQFKRYEEGKLDLAQKAVQARNKW